MATSSSEVLLSWNDCLEDRKVHTRAVNVIVDVYGWLGSGSIGEVKNVAGKSSSISCLCTSVPGQKVPTSRPQVEPNELHRASSRACHVPQR